MELSRRMQIDHTDVGMFIDWENMHGFIRGKANISALREIAERFGRLVLAKAYADWREMRFQADSLVLYKGGVEPVYVPSGTKNNIDVKLATDCMDFAYRYPSIGCIILVTGDGDFIHTATALRPLGKKVIVIAQSNNASGRLGDLVDQLLIYDRDVVPVETVEDSVHISRNQKQPKDINEAFDRIVEILRDSGSIPVLITQVKDRLIRDYGTFSQQVYGYEKFRDMLKEGENRGYFVVNTAALRDWLILKQDSPQGSTSTSTLELPSDNTQAFQEITHIIRGSRQADTLFSYIKLCLVQKYGGFDESIYGFSSFKQMMTEGERLGYFVLGVNDKGVDYARLPPA